MSTDADTSVADKLDRIGKHILAACVPLPLLLYVGFSIGGVIADDRAVVLGLVGPESEPMSGFVAGFYVLQDPSAWEHIAFWAGNCALLYGAVALVIHAIAFQRADNNETPTVASLRAADNVVSVLGWILFGLILHTLAAHRTNNSLDFTIFHIYGMAFGYAVLGVAHKYLKHLSTHPSREDIHNT